MSYKMLPVGSWRKGDITPWYHVTEDPIVINDENAAEYNLPGRGVLPGEVLVRVCHATDGGRAMRIFTSEEHLVKTQIPTVREKEYKRAEEVDPDIKAAKDETDAAALADADDAAAEDAATDAEAAAAQAQGEDEATG